MEITKIIRKANEALSEFKERWTDEASRISGVPEVMQISSFMDGCKCTELAKRFSEKIPRTVIEMMIRVDDFIRSERAYRLTGFVPAEMIITHNDPPSEEITEKISTKNSSPDEMITLYLTVLPERKIPT